MQNLASILKDIGERNKDGDSDLKRKINRLSDRINHL